MWQFSITIIRIIRIVIITILHDDNDNDDNINNDNAFEVVDFFAFYEPPGRKHASGRPKALEAGRNSAKKAKIIRKI